MTEERREKEGRIVSCRWPATRRSMTQGELVYRIDASHLVGSVLEIAIARQNGMHA